MRELFTDSIRAGLANIDLHDLKEPAPDAKAPELIFKRLRQVDCSSG